MKLIITKEIIDKAIKAYEEERFSDPMRLATNNLHIVNHIRAIENIFKVLDIKIKQKFVAEAMDAYEEVRSPFRWDGKPWGQAGTRNHRKAIKNLLKRLAQNSK